MKKQVDYKLTFFFFVEAMTIFLLVTIIFAFLLIYGKVMLASRYGRMLIHHKLILSGKEEVKEETRWIFPSSLELFRIQLCMFDIRVDI